MTDDKSSKWLSDSITWKALLPILATMITVGGSLAAFVLNMYDTNNRERTDGLHLRIERVENRADDRLGRIEDKLDRLLQRQ